MFSNMPKKTHRALDKDAALFDAAANFEWLRGAGFELHCFLRVNVERLDHALQFGWATDLLGEPQKRVRLC